MEIKTKKAIELYKVGEFKKAFAIFKTFKLGFTKEEKDTIITSYEIQVGNGGFYESLGFDLNKTIEESHKIIKLKYNL